MTDRFISDHDPSQVAQDPPPSPYGLPRARVIADAPVIKLFTPGHVALATFLGSPLAGGVVLAWSHRRAKTGRGWTALLAGAALTGALLALGFALNGKAGGGLAIGGLFAMRGLAQAQMPGIEAACGGRAVTASWWSAVGISVGFLGACVAAVFALGIGWAVFSAPASVSFGHDQDVQYADGATTADARLVGSYLMQKGFFSANGEGKTDRVERTRGDVVVSFVIQDGAWNQAMVQLAFTEVRKELADTFPGQQVTVHLCDDTMENQYTIRE